MIGIKQRQINLRTYYGCYMGAIDGIAGNGTVNAYRTFQRMVGLSVDGIYGPNTERALIGNIQDIQSKLNKFGYSLTVDGLVGDRTINAIKDFQSKNGLGIDGIVGNATMSKLNGYAPSHYTCKYFKDSEFTCKCGCGTNYQKDGIKRIADEIREWSGGPAIINSGTRCRKHNAEVGGVSNSYHLYGNAIDIQCNNKTGNQLLAFCNEIVRSGRARYCYLISGSKAVHIDTGGKE